MEVFIIGIAGGTGSRVARLLAEKGDKVSGLYRRPEQLASIQALGASGTLGDVATISEKELASAVSGADVLVFTAGAGDHDKDSMIDAVDRDGVRKTIAAARIAGISRLLLVSVFPEAWRERHMPESFEHYMGAKKRADVDLDLEQTETSRPGTNLRRRILEVTAGSTPIASCTQAAANETLATDPLLPAFHLEQWRGEGSKESHMSKSPISWDESRPDHHTLGNAGELHQIAGGTHPPLTTQTGTVIGDDENSLKAGPRGPSLLEDLHFLEKMQHFDHERIPERIVHARGFGAHGYFELTDSLAGITRAKIFNEVGRKTEVFTRFSTVAGNKGSSDMARDVRGFAVKFYTDEGNWDLVGNNIPVFFIQDAMKFPDLIHAAKPEPDRGFPQAQTAHDTFWDFASLMPESTHMLMWIMSDRAIPRSFRMMEGFGVHTYRFVNDEGKSTFVKFHWRPKLGMQSVCWDEALKISGADPDFHRRDLWNAIEEGKPAEWELGLQLFDQEFADSFDFDVLDATKLIPEEILPLRIVGRLVLDTNVTNFFAETEQVAFCVRNVVPGIDFSNDPLLQGRIFSYQDTQLSRLGGPNFQQIPANAPRCPVMHNQRDGHMQMSKQAGRVHYSPSSLMADSPRQDPKLGFTSFAEPLEGEKGRIRASSFADHFSQARQFFYSQTEPEQNHIISAFIFELSKVETKAVRERMVGQLANVDPSIAKRVATGVGMTDTPAAVTTTVAARTDLEPSPALSILANAKPTLEGRVIGCLISDGTDADLVLQVELAVTALKADFKIVAPKVGGATAADGRVLEVDFQLAGGSSVLFDHVFVVLSEGAAKLLSTEAAAVAWVHDAFQHLKVLGATDGAKALLDKAGVVSDEGVLIGSDLETYLGTAARGKVFAREPNVRTVF